MAERALKFDVKDSIGIITFDQPGSRANTLNQAVQGEFEEILADLKKRTDLQGLIICSGKPGMFIAGADLRELGSAENNPDMSRKLVRQGTGGCTGRVNYLHNAVILSARCNWEGNGIGEYHRHQPVLERFNTKDCPVGDSS